MDHKDLSRFSLEGRTAIITGGSGGIRSACASTFAKAGANIVIRRLRRIRFSLGAGNRSAGGDGSRVGD